MDRQAALCRILHVAELQRECGLTMRDVLTQVQYLQWREHFEADDLLLLVEREPALVTQWQAYSEDKRTAGGWYLQHDVLGRLDRMASRERWPTPAQATAHYIVRELDFWAGLGG
ncbi:hypothetical protein [Solimonas marina]|uniref:Uncharacterized protein n=1 Tax=Solimonas marina TaxID=2714601 RepID=A0A970B739_9GAMM|nr:hypothetical protein [Solimonas marina]NKF20814.1 hypothetical protein [Solimonas marina]